MESKKVMSRNVTRLRSGEKITCYMYILLYEAYYNIVCMAQTTLHNSIEPGSEYIIIPHNSILIRSIESDVNAQVTKAYIMRIHSAHKSRRICQICAVDLDTYSP